MPVLPLITNEVISLSYNYYSFPEPPAEDLKKHQPRKTPQRHLKNYKTVP